MSERERVRRGRVNRNGDAIRNALERAAVVSRNGVFRNLVHTPRRRIGIEICPPMRFPFAKGRPGRGWRFAGKLEGGGGWQWKLYDCLNCAMHIEKDYCSTSRTEHARFGNGDCIAKKFSGIYPRC